MAESIKARLSSRVVVPESSRRQRRERNISPEHRNNRRNNRDYQQHDDRATSPERRTNDRDYHNDNVSRRNKVHANDNLAVKERLGFTRGNERPAKVIEVNLDPRDVPRGKRYFEHDDREASYGNRNFSNNINRRRSFPRQRSRSPIWRHDRFTNNDRRNRTQRERQPWQRDHNSRSSVWKHDKFEELETEEKKGSKEKQEEENQTSRKKRRIMS